MGLKEPRKRSSKPFALIYRIYYRLLGTQLNPSAINHREPSSMSTKDEG